MSVNNNFFNYINDLVTNIIPLSNLEKFKKLSIFENDILNLKKLDIKKNKKKIPKLFNNKKNHLEFFKLELIKRNLNFENLKLEFFQSLYIILLKKSIECGLNEKIINKISKLEIPNIEKIIIKIKNICEQDNKWIDNISNIEKKHYTYLDKYDPIYDEKFWILNPIVLIDEKDIPKDFNNLLLNVDNNYPTIKKKLKDFTFLSKETNEKFLINLFKKKSNIKSNNNSNNNLNNNLNKKFYSQDEYDIFLFENQILLINEEINKIWNKIEIINNKLNETNLCKNNFILNEYNINEYIEKREKKINEIENKFKNPKTYFSIDKTIETISVKLTNTEIDIIKEREFYFNEIKKLPNYDPYSIKLKELIPNTFNINDNVKIIEITLFYDHFEKFHENLLLKGSESDIKNFFSELSKKYINIKPLDIIFKKGSIVIELILPEISKIDNNKIENLINNIKENDIKYKFQIKEDLYSNIKPLEYQYLFEKLNYNEIKEKLNKLNIFEEINSKSNKNSEIIDNNIKKEFYINHDPIFNYEETNSESCSSENSFSFDEELGCKNFKNTVPRVYKSSIKGLLFSCCISFNNIKQKSDNINAEDDYIIELDIIRKRALTSLKSMYTKLIERNNIILNLIKKNENKITEKSIETLQTVLNKFLNLTEILINNLQSAVTNQFKSNNLFLHKFINDQLQLYTNQKLEFENIKNILESINNNNFVFNNNKHNENESTFEYLKTSVNNIIGNSISLINYISSKIGILKNFIGIWLFLLDSEKIKVFLKTIFDIIDIGNTSNNIMDFFISSYILSIKLILNSLLDSPTLLALVIFFVLSFILKIFEKSIFLQNIIKTLINFVNGSIIFNHNELYKKTVDYIQNIAGKTIVNWLPMLVGIFIVTIYNSPANIIFNGTVFGTKLLYSIGESYIKTGIISVNVLSNFDFSKDSFKNIYNGNYVDIYRNKNTYFQKITKWLYDLKNTTDINKMASIIYNGPFVIIFILISIFIIIYWYADKSNIFEMENDSNGISVNKSLENFKNFIQENKNIINAQIKFIPVNFDY